MIHAVYQKSRPKAKWHLVSVTTSPESANTDLDEARKQATAEGLDQFELAVKNFESAFHIPMFLDEVKDTKVLFN